MLVHLEPRTLVLPAAPVCVVVLVVFAPIALRHEICSLSDCNMDTDSGARVRHQNRPFLPPPNHTHT